MKFHLSFSLLCVHLLTTGCSSTIEAQPAITAGNLFVDNRNRSYLITLPAKQTDKAKALVIALHGGGGSAAQCERDYGWTGKSVKEDFIVVYPDGVPSDRPLKLRTWNAGSCCHYASETNVDDVKFISTLIDDLVSKYPIDKKRVYVTGMSNGAMMAYRLACEIPEKISAIATVSGPLMTTQTCNASRAVPLLHIHSEKDEKVPYAGGTGIFNYSFTSMDSTLSVWTSINHCTDKSPTITRKELYTLYEWTSCDQIIKNYVTKDGGHAWPGAVKARARADSPSQAFKATDLIWDFFKEFQLP